MSARAPLRAARSAPAVHPARRARFALALVSMLVLGAGLVACGATPAEHGQGDGIEGTGDTVQVLRDLEPFTRVSIAAGLKVIIGEAAEQEVTLMAQENLLPVIETEVRDGQLIVTLAEPVNATQPMSLTLRMTAVESVALSAGSVAFVEHTGGPLALDVSAGAQLTAIGNTDDLRLNASSGAHAKLGELVAASAEIRVNDGSTVELSVATSLTGTADGGSTVILAGRPAMIDVETLSGATIQGG